MALRFVGLTPADVERIEHWREFNLASFDFVTACGEFGGAERLRTLAILVREQPANPGLDARIALEVGWLRPYAVRRHGKYVVTGVTTGDYFENYPLYAPWFTGSPRKWWDNGSAICNRVPNIPKYSSDPCAALKTFSGSNGQARSIAIFSAGESWTVRITGAGDEEVVGVCERGVETMAKALVLAGIDSRLRPPNPRNVPVSDETDRVRNDVHICR